MNDLGENMNFRFGQPELKGKYDVAVVGGGVAGVAAALAAAREGASVVLLEKLAALGGLGTVGLINWYEPLCDGKGRKIIGGICEEMLLESIKYGGDDLAQDWKETGASEQGNMKKRRYVTHYSPTAFAVALLGMLKDAGVTVRFDTLATYPQGEGGHIDGILCETKSGCEYFECKVIIDASGDADVFHRFGCECLTGKNFMSYTSHYLDFASKDDLKLATVRKWTLTGATMTGGNQPEDVPLLEGVTSDDVNTYLIAGQTMLLDKLKTMDRNAGEFVSIPMMAQFRTTRHIVGEYTLTEDDIYRHFDDSIGTFGDFRPSRRGQWYEVPYRTLYSVGCDNLLAAGRVISSEGEAWKATRVIPVCCLTGEAAGRAAAIAAADGVGVADVDVAKLRRKMADNKNIVDYEEI